MGKNSGYEFIDTIFGRDRELDRTEKLISAIRLWSMRSDANCDDILRNPTAGYDKATTRDTAPCNGDPTTPQPIPSSTSDEACKDPLGNAVPSADQTVVSSKKKLDDKQGFIDEVASRKKHISTEAHRAQQGQLVMPEKWTI